VTENIKVRLETPFESSPAYINDIDHVPNAEGLWVPFFSDLHHFDKATVPNVIETYFMGCLGNDAESAIEMSRNIRAAWGNIAYTEFGKQIAHLAFCIRIALEAQARVVPLFRGDYAGV